MQERIQMDKPWNGKFLNSFELHTYISICFVEFVYFLLNLYQYISLQMFLFVFHWFIITNL